MVRFGVRYSGASVRAEVIGFISDYNNLLGECTSSSGNNCEIGDAFNGDAATVSGVEALFSNTFAVGHDLQLPMSFSYTYINGEFNTDIADTAFFGDVSAGDSIPYIPENQFQFSVGLHSGRWQINANLSYVDAVCSRASCGQFEQTDSSMTLDLAGQYLVRDNIKIFARIENASDERKYFGPPTLWSQTQ